MRFMMFVQVSELEDFPVNEIESGWRKKEGADELELELRAAEQRQRAQVAGKR